jgi:hypothetical protein
VIGTPEKGKKMTTALIGNFDLGKRCAVALLDLFCFAYLLHPTRKYARRISNGK